MRAKFVSIDSSGTERLVHIALHAPVPTTRGAWACLVEPDPLIGGPRGGFVGQDAIQAIALALTFVQGRLEDFCDKGGRIAFDDEARTDVPLDAQFGHIGARPELASTATYEDGYASCAETYATLRIFSDDLDPDVISGELGLKPTRSFRKGEQISPRVPRPRPEHGWFLCTDGLVDSRDTRRHIDWLLDKIVFKAPAFARVTEDGTRSDIYSYWVSARGQGGPMLSAPQMRRLAMLGLECIYDVYFAGDDEEHAG